ncbi:MAG: YcxB family protein [Brevinematales bacterium]|nr:YcxB family protein [Brevinematales bacterium]
MTEIEVVFTYSKQEFIRAMRRYLRTRLRFVPFSIIGAVLLAASIVFLLTDGPTIYSLTLMILSSILILILLLGIFYMPVVAYNSQSKYKDEYRLKFTPGHIYFKTAAIDSTIGWEFYGSSWETDEFYYLFNTRRSVSIIPKRAFKSDSDLSGFARLLSEKFGGNAVQK